MADVNSLVTAAQGYVAQVLVPADAAMQSAIDAVSQIGYTQLTYSPVALPALPKVPVPQDASLPIQATGYRPSRALPLRLPSRKHQRCRRAWYSRTGTPSKHA